MILTVLSIDDSDCSHHTLARINVGVKASYRNIYTLDCNHFSFTIICVQAMMNKLGFFKQIVVNDRRTILIISIRFKW